MPVSLTVGGREHLGSPIVLADSDVTDVVLTLDDRPTQISGTVRNREGRPAIDARVIIFPKEPALRGDYVATPAPRRIQQALIRTDGTFEATLPPGEYLVTAVTTLPAMWMDPEYLGSLAATARSVTVTAGGRATVALEVRAP